MPFLFAYSCTKGSVSYDLTHFFFLIISSPEPSGSQGEPAYSIPMLQRPSVHNVQTSAPPKSLGQLKPNLMWSLLGKGEEKFFLY